MTNPPDNPHPIGTLAYWQTRLAEIDQRANIAAAGGFPIKARGLRDDAAQVRIIIDRVKAELPPEPVVTTKQDALPEVPPAKERNEAHYATCQDCGKKHQGKQGRCRDCKTAYRDRGDLKARVKNTRDLDRKRYMEHKLKDEKDSKRYLDKKDSQ